NNTATFTIFGGTSSGCDSIVNLDLTILNSSTGTDTRTECDSYTWIDGNTYTANNNSTTFNITNGAANGCDSLVTLNLTIVNATSGTDTKTECNSYTWIDGINYSANNNTATFNIVGGAAKGCDSLVTLDLTIVNSTSGTDTRTECNSYTWIDGINYTASNNSATFNIVGGAANGCDSLVTLDLTIINSTSGTDTKTECNSYTWIDGNTYTANNNSATFNITNGAANGCDSLVSLDLTIFNSTSGTDTRTECNSYTWIDGNTYTASNNSATFNIVGGAANGCDSLVSLDLTVSAATGTDTRTKCNSYTWIDGNTYTASNNSATFNIVGGAANGCDSLVTLDLTIVNSTSGTDTRTECSSYTWIDGNTYTASNNSATFNIVGGAASGCDSLVSLDLTIVNSTSGTDTRTECNSYTWIDGNTYTANNNSGTFNITNGAANGCDSLVILNLTINNVTDITTSSSGAIISANNLGATYQWLDCDSSNATITGETGQSYTAVANGNYAVELTENGCVDTSACVNIITTAVLENNFGSEFNIYPNPTKGTFSVDLDKTYNSILITITDLSGRLIETKEYNGTKLLNLKIDEPAGIYLLKIETGNQKAIIRLVKE
ncbi:MAG: T9SS type A sorting domain-containing protein, partial [Flavobacteriales bacterium]